MKREVITYNEIQGFHCWPDASRNVAYLASQHRHMFVIRCRAEVSHNEREIMQMLSDALDGNHQGMAIVMKGTHLCKSMRGVKSQGEMTVSVLTGIFKRDGEARREFYKLIDTQKR